MSKTKKILFLILVVSIFRFNHGAIETNTVVTYNFTTSNSRLTNEMSLGEEFLHIEKTIEAFLRKWAITGASIAIAKDGKLIYSRGFGYADTTSKTLVQPYNKFRIASVSKLVTAVAIMKLAEENRLSLNDKVFGADGILTDPYFDNPIDKRAYEITVEHLLSHEGGWSQRYGDQMFMPILIAEAMNVAPPVDLKTIVRFALNKKLHFAPGSEQSYSNLGYGILGLVIEKITGATYEEYCKKAVLEPLGIYDMSIAGNMPSEKAAFEVTYYEPSDIELKPSVYGAGEMTSPSYGGNDIQTLGAAGAWIATAPDLMRLLLAVDGFSSRPDILSSKNIYLMASAARPLGWRAADDNGAWVRTGSFSGSSAMMKRQADGVSWVVLFNSSTWNGHNIQSHINSAMTSVISQIKEWPDYDLFRHSLPVPLTILR